MVSATTNSINAEKVRNKSPGSRTPTPTLAQESTTNNSNKAAPLVRSSSAGRLLSSIMGGGRRKNYMFKGKLSGSNSKNYRTFNEHGTDASRGDGNFNHNGREITEVNLDNGQGQNYHHDADSVHRTDGREQRTNSSMVTNILPSSSLDNSNNGNTNTIYNSAFAGGRTTNHLNIHNMQNDSAIEEQLRQQESYLSLSPSQRSNLSSKINVPSVHRRSQNTQQQLYSHSYAQSQEQAEIQQQVITSLEQVLRQSLMLIIAYLLGVYQPFQVINTYLTPSIIMQLAQIIGVAWVTCILIQVLTWSRQGGDRGMARTERLDDARGHFYNSVSKSFDLQRQQREGFMLGDDSENLEGGLRMIVPPSRGELNERLSADYKNMSEEGKLLLRHLDFDEEEKQVKESRKYAGAIFKGGTVEDRGADMETSSGNEIDANSISNRDTRNSSKSEEPIDQDVESIEEENVIGNKRATPTSVKRPSSFTSKLKKVKKIPPNIIDIRKQSPTFPSSDQKLEVLPPRPPPVDLGRQQQKQNHAELEDVYLINNKTAERISPNGHPVPFDNDLCHGVMLPMLRTSDADSTSAGNGDNVGNTRSKEVSNYFREKQRRFEFQFQVKLKQVPEGKLYLSCELDKSIKLGMIQRAFVGATLNFVKKTNPGFHYSLSGSDGGKEDDVEDGRYEVPHLSFPVEASVDRVAITKPGEKPPKLGEDIYESSESMKKRRKGGIDFNTEDTYTLAIWSAYVDFIKWKCLNFPGIRPFSLASVIGDQPFNLVMYTLVSSDKKHHYQGDMKKFVSYEFSHSKKTYIGPGRKKWMESRNTLQNVTRKEINMEGSEPSIPIKGENVVENEYSVQDDSQSTVAEDTDGGDVENQIDPEDYIPGRAIEDEEDEEDAQTIEDLGQGIYLKSGDPIILRESNSIDKDIFLTNGGRFAVLQSQTTSNIIIEKVTSFTNVAEGADSTNLTWRTRSKLIKSGDIVHIKLVLKKSSEEEGSAKYLTVHRGWWLKWVSYVPKTNGHFNIFTNEVEGELDSLHRIETQSSYVRLGGTFYLKMRRWPLYQVGISIDSSPKFGGRVIGLYKEGSAHVVEVDSAQMDDEEEEIEQPDPPIDSKGKKQWMKPLRLCADMPSIRNIQTNPILCDEINDEAEIISTQTPMEKYHLDTPAWLEMMHRTKRELQRVYVIRMNIDQKFNVNSNEEASRQYSSTPDLQICEESSVTYPSREERTNTECTLKPLIRLRTGQELSPILSLGLTLKNTAREESKDGDSISFIEEDKEVAANQNAGSEVSDRSRNNSEDLSQNDTEDDENVGDSDSCNKNSHEENHENLPQNTFQNEPLLNEIIQSDSELNVYESEGNSVIGETDNEEEVDIDEFESDYDVQGHEDIEDFDTSDIDGDGDGELYLETEYPHNILEHDSPSSAVRRKKRKWIKKQAVGIGKVAKTATFVTGKSVIKQGKFVGKVSVTAGRAISKSLIVHKNKPKGREPRTKLAVKKRRNVKDHHVAVNKTLKSRKKSLSESSKYTIGLPARIMAGQLNAPDQSCRIVSHVLSELSQIAMLNLSKTSDSVSKLIHSQLSTITELDSRFLRGSCVELGVSPFKHEEETKVTECIVARCLWESRWREEACVLYDSCIAFYAPLTKKPCLILSFMDVQSISRIDDNEATHPLSGFPLICVETAWHCHYLAFADDACRSNFHQNLNSLIFSFGSGESRMEKNVWKAHIWQGFQALSVKGKWAKIVSSNKAKERVILNGRRMVFDSDEFASENSITYEKSISDFVENLLRKALSFSLETLEKSLEDFIEFLDDTSRLRSLSLQELDLSNKSAFCICINLYHCLLQHAFLLSPYGPPHKKSIGHFMRTSCYEIGGDIFSLAELECCVIRGNMSKPIHPKPPFVEAPKKSRAHQSYALGTVDPRTNFVLNSGDWSKSPYIPILTPEKLEEQLSLCSVSFLNEQIFVDPVKKVVTLPKVCEVYRNDFGNGDPQSCAHFCLQYLREEKQLSLVSMINTESGGPIYKYQSSCELFHSNLKPLDESPLQAE